MPSNLLEQFPSVTEHHDVYPAIDPTGALKGSASGKVIFMSGASQGIGQATAVAFAQAGAKAIYITARSERALQETQRKVQEANPVTQCAYRICDVTEHLQVKAAVEDCVTRFGAIDVADANAGYLGNWVKIAESDPQSWWKSWEVNIKGSYNLIRESIPHLIESAAKEATTGRSGGHLILISSVGAQFLTPGASDYQASKHAINRLCEFVNVDHGADGVKCFAVHPGGVATSLAKNMPNSMHEHLVDAPELAAGFITWLASGKGDWATGRYLSSTWDVDELGLAREAILTHDLMVNRLRAKT